MGTAGSTAIALGQFLKNAYKNSTRLILDADALNLLSKHPKWKDRVPAGTILTPHPQEFDRLTGVHANSWERLSSLKQLAMERNWVVVLKNAFSFTSTENGELFLTSRGNTALARGGSGDVLAGIMAALSARDATSQATARIATWLLGRAAECTADQQGEEGILLTDILKQLPMAFADLRNDSGSDEFFGYF
jgi:NAD(P)H-hydrate epimerase